MIVKRPLKPIRLEFVSPDFWDISPHHLIVQESEVTGRIYYLDRRGRLLATAKIKEDDHEVRR
jgi:hypothetical protein